MRETATQDGVKGDPMMRGTDPGCRRKNAPERFHLALIAR